MMTLYKPEDIDDAQSVVNVQLKAWEKKQTGISNVSIDLSKCLYNPLPDHTYKITLTGDCDGEKNITLGFFRLSGFPYNCGCVILFDLVTCWMAQQGIGTLLLECAEIIALDCSNYSYMMATTNSENMNCVFYDMAIKRGWYETDSFFNLRSENTCKVIVKKSSDDE
jgi:hypothetical protein